MYLGWFSWAGESFGPAEKEKNVGIDQVTKMFEIAEEVWNCRCSGTFGHGEFGYVKILVLPFLDIKIIGSQKKPPLLPYLPAGRYRTGDHW